MNGLNENIIKTSLIVASFIIAGIMGLLVDPAWLLLLLVPLFGIPLLREAGVLRDADERETWDHYRGSHLAFYAIMIYIAISSFEEWISGNIFFHYDFLVIIAIALAVKLFAGLSSVLDRRVAATFVSAIYGIVWLIISVFSSHGLPQMGLASLGGLLVLLFAAVGWFAPLFGGPALISLSVLFIFYPLNFLDSDMFLMFKIFYFILICSPLAVAGWLLISERLQKHFAKAESGTGEVAK